MGLAIKALSCSLAHSMKYDTEVVTLSGAEIQRSAINFNFLSAVYSENHKVKVECSCRGGRSLTDRRHKAAGK